MAVASYRDIVLQGIIAKDFRNAIRFNAHDDFGADVRPTQFVGVPGRGTDMRQHAGRAAWEGTIAFAKS
eukprot:6823602-Lingulodinium_polyedra.AAC.1